VGHERLVSGNVKAVEQYLEFIKDGFKAQAGGKIFLNDIKLLN
jgi:hypothetical protein